MPRQFSISRLFGRRPGPDPAQDGEAQDAAAAAGPLTEVRTGQTIEALIASGLVQLRLQEESGRLTDLLNRDAPAVLVRTDGGQAPAVDDLLVVVPPPQTTDRARRLHRPGRPVLVVIGPYEVTGSAHVPPGSQPTGFLLRTNPRFVPLTGATIHSTRSDVADQRVDVAIVNLHRADRFRDITPEDQP